MSSRQSATTERSATCSARRSERLSHEAFPRGGNEFPEDAHHVEAGMGTVPAKAHGVKPDSLEHGVGELGFAGPCPEREARENALHQL